VHCVAIAADQRASTMSAPIAETLAATGGVPARVLADPMACLKGGVVANVVIPTADYVRLASRTTASHPITAKHRADHRQDIPKAQWAMRSQTQ